MQRYASARVDAIEAVQHDPVMVLLDFICDALNTTTWVLATGVCASAVLTINANRSRVYLTVFYLRSNAARSQLPKSAAASYVVWKNESTISSGLADVRTASYGSKNYLSCVL